MTQKLDSQYEAINSPWAGYAVYSFPDASRVAVSHRTVSSDSADALFSVGYPRL